MLILLKRPAAWLTYSYTPFLPPLELFLYKSDISWFLLSGLSLMLRRSLVSETEDPASSQIVYKRCYYPLLLSLLRILSSCEVTSSRAGVDSLFSNSFEGASIKMISSI